MHTTPLRVTILRGISGSGKTTWANTHKEEALILSTDKYFEQSGTYTFDGAKLQDYHRQTFREYMEAILRREPWIIVDNTNIKLWEFVPYVAAAEVYGYTVEILTFSCSVATSLQRKQLLAEWKLQQKARDLEEETKRFPRSIAEIHTVLDCETNAPLSR